MKRLISLALIISSFSIIGCQTPTITPYYSDVSYKAGLDGEEIKAPLLFQYKFISPVEEHELMIIDNESKQYFIRIKGTQEARQGFIVNLPANHQYALASFFIINGGAKKELQLGQNLTLFRLSREKLTRVRGFDIINDQDPKTNSVSIAPWDGMTDNLLIIQAAKKFQVPEKFIRTIDIFKKQN